MAFILFLINFAMKMCPCCCCCKKGENKEECYKKIIFFVYDYLNKFFDYTRHLMYVEDPYLLGGVMVSCIALAIIGKCFSSVIILLIAFNIFVIIQFNGIKDKIAETYKKVTKQVGEMADKFIPSYKETMEKEVPKFE